MKKSKKRETGTIVNMGESDSSKTGSIIRAHEENVNNECESRIFFEE